MSDSALHLLHAHPPASGIAGCNALRSLHPAMRTIPYFNQPRFRKYQNGVIALATISTIANG
ncbi:hypothetical protein SAMN06295970_10171 [Noviherbaspirillum suwonense]|uniref:Uncharacterized protein n=1 Tax=Noviherbaspirillum suwonense TaxID=1224511 RepID=A0ABY1PQQ1_9BURK|nr:hypothetical protein SAMN06295970_10171 [Noviherbaspirillum suwonense]